VFHQIARVELTLVTLHRLGSHFSRTRISQ